MVTFCNHKSNKDSHWKVLSLWIHIIYQTSIFLNIFVAISMSLKLNKRTIRKLPFII